MEAITMMKTLVLCMLLAVTVHADDTDPPPSIDSPPSDLPLPQTPPLPKFPPPEVDPITPPPMSCKDQCVIKCAEKRGLRRLICVGSCLVMCGIVSSDGAGYHCARDCVINSLHRLSNIKSVDGLVDGCYSNCTKHV